MGTQETIVRTASDDGTIAETDALVRVLDGRQAVGDPDLGQKNRPSAFRRS